MIYEEEAKELNKIIMEIIKNASLYTGIYCSPLSKSEMNILHVVVDNFEREEPANMSKTSEILGISKPALTQIVNKLFFKGYIKKYRVKGDCKNTYLKLTEKGLKTYREFERHAIGFLSGFIEKIGLEDCRKFGLILEKFNSSMPKGKQKG